MMKKRFLSFLLAALLAFALILPAAAVEFSDLSGHWARSYMLDLAERGYMTGYGDGTIKPNANLTTCEALILLSRLYGANGDEAAAIYQKHKTVIDAYSTKTWANNYLAVCLETGILRDGELKNMSLDSAIEKEKLAVLLVRAMRLGPEADELMETELAFGDAADINANYVGYIALLVNAGILTGDGNNNFLPHSSVTRAIAATMISRTLDYLEKKGVALAAEAFDGIVGDVGIIISVVDNSVDVRGFDGIVREYALGSDSVVTVGGNTAAFSSSFVGRYTAIEAADGEIKSLAAGSGKSTTWAQGVLSHISGSTIKLTDPDTGVSTSYSVPWEATVVQDYSEITYAGLQSGHFVTLRIVNGTVDKVVSIACNGTLSGTLLRASYDTTTTLKILRDNTVYCIRLDIGDLPSIKRGNSVISIDSLRIGDDITVYMEGGYETSIVAKNSDNTFTGTLVSVQTSTGTGNVSTVTYWTIDPPVGSEKTFALSETVNVYSGSNSILLGSINIGDTITVSYYNNIITDVYLENSAVPALNEVTGAVLSANATTKQVIILYSGKLIYVDVSAAGSVISASTGKAIAIGDIKANSSLTAYGAYVTSNTFKASTVLIK